MTDPAAQASDRKLTPEGLATLAEADPALVRQLIDAGAIHPDGDGWLGLGDVPRVRFAHVLAESGVDVDGLMWAIRSGILPLERFPEMWAPPEPSLRTYAEFAGSLGALASHLPAVYAAFGFAEPSAGTIMRLDEQEVLTDFLAAWALVEDDREVYIRAARIAGEGVRRIEVATYDLFDEFEGSPPQRARRGLSEDEALEPSMRLSALLPRLLVWLERRQAEHELFERIVAFVESALAAAGRMPPKLDEPAAIAFVDLAGYTTLTERAGDELAARSALTLQGLAEDAARAHRGRVVKLLG